MTTEKSPLEQALDLVLYGPVGLAVTAGENRDEMVDKGRQRVSAQVGMARMIGQFAVAQAEKEARKLRERVVGAVNGVRSDGATTAPPGPSDGAPTTASPTGAAPPATRRRADAGSRAGGAAAPVTGGARSMAADGLPEGPARSSAHLAIPGYDTLSAPQVVQRLAGLAPEELAAVGAYEEAMRGRRTILSKVAQLRADQT